MSKLLPMDTQFTESHFQFSTMPIERLGATEYTLVTLALDMSGSVDDFVQELSESVKEVLSACRKSPRAENLLLRLVTFNNNVYEEHGFKLIKDIKEEDYHQMIRPNGMTALFDATISSIEAMSKYGKTLTEEDFDVNGIMIVVTDGMDNQSKYDQAKVKESFADVKLEESLESIRSILVGVNTKIPRVKDYLMEYKDHAGFDQYIDIDDADANSLAKLANFISQSISNQSQALGTGGPSKALTF